MLVFLVALFLSLSQIALSNVVDTTYYPIVNVAKSQNTNFVPTIANIIDYKEVELADEPTQPPWHAIIIFAFFIGLGVRTFLDWYTSKSKRE
jgi:hypothetical protein